ncbi:MAG: ribosome maturation factor RimM [Anaerolineae bacterium]
MPRLDPKYLVVGEIVAAHGIQGEVKVLLETSFPDRFKRLKSVLIGPPDGSDYRSVGLKGSRLHKGSALLKLAGVDDRNAAEALRGQVVVVPADQAMPLGEDEYYVHQIEGLTVYTEDGERLGTVDHVIFTGANEVYVVRDDDGEELLLPAIADVVQSVDLANERMTVRLLEGLR